LSKYLIGVDIGTSGCKVVIFNENLESKSSAYESYLVNIPKPGWMEVDPNKVLFSFCKAIRLALNNIEKIGKYDSFYLSFSVIGNSLVISDKNGEILYPCILSQDLRSKNYLPIIREIIDEEEIVKITGRFLHTKSQLPRILWVKKNLANIIDKNTLFLDFQSWLMLKLGFKPVTDYSLAAGSMLFDIYKKDWSKTLLNYTNLHQESLPVCFQAGTYVGKLSNTTLTMLGFPISSEVKLFIGAFDQMCNTVGGGAIKERDFICSSGTLEVVTIVLPSSISESSIRENKIFIVPGAISNQFVTMVTIWNAGNALSWFCNNFAKQEIKEAKKKNIHIFDLLLEKKINNHSIIFLPHLSGSSTLWLDPSSRGAFLGLTCAADVYTIANSIIEGITFELKEGLEKYKLSIGNLSNIFKVIGGGSKSKVWLQLKADILNKEVVSLDFDEVGCIGAAILAGYGSGIFSNFEEGILKSCKIKEHFYPSERNSFLQSKYEIYKKIYPSLKEINYQLSELE